MEYSIKELAKLAGISTRTLRYYDEIGLLKPAYINDAGYRFYSSDEVALLQQILFYRERGLDLKTIGKIIHDSDFDMLSAMEDHLLELENEKARTEVLIETVKKTIEHMKGEREMTDMEKFQAFREEAAEKYGEEEVNASYEKMSGLTGAELQKWKDLEAEILSRLEQAVKSGIGADSEEGKAIADLHRQWLRVPLKQYTPEMHRGIAAMYICDERFTKYYDRNISGCAQLLKDAVHKWII